ncbi:HNH/ENDO VII family nuclease [Massilia sp.]|uniref:HNH/ENDO VII family nuclease n=1 Tax=Massilia sp. TaxID=1882437 RepID=UPI00352F4C71
MIARTHGAIVSEFRYDPVGRLLSQTAGEGASTVIARQYEYDEVGKLVSIDDQRNGITRYSYDPIGRILSAVQPQLSERFAFDPAHNLLDATVAPVGRVEGNRIRVYEDKRYDYDAHGNVVEKLVGKHTRMRFEWNPGHQLVRSVVARGPTDSAQTVSYAYDPFGRRIAKRDAFGVTRFVWDGNRLLCEQRGSHARTYVYGEDAFVPLARVDTVADSGGAARAEVRHLHTDHLGTPREMTDAGGRLVWAARYRAWGNVLEVVQEAVPAVVLPDEIGEVQPVRFQGQYYDNESGLHYNLFRYYDPDIGRFVSIDLIGLLGGVNTFAYTSNPISWVDPLGLAPCRFSENGENPGRVYWPNQTEFEGIKVYPRNDTFDPNLVTSWRAGGKVISGTNIERMATGRAPIGTDGKPINLHHMLQSNDSAIAELMQTFHQKNSKIIHINPNVIPSGIDRSAFDAWKARYWANRATNYGAQ